MSNDQHSLSPGMQWLYETLDSLRSEQRDQHQRLRSDITAMSDRLDERIAAMDAKVTTTNGRLREMERELIVLRTKWEALVWIVLFLILPITWWLLDGLKDWMKHAP